MHRRDFLKTAPAAGLGLAAGAAATPLAAHGAAPGLSAADRRMVGDIAVTSISDGGVALGHGPLIGIDEADYRAILQDNFRDPDDFRSGVNAFLIETGDARVLIDCGTGGAFGPQVDNLPANLAATGYAPEDITHLFFTHLHTDHFGGALRDGTVIFPNAEVVLSETERAFWTDASNFAEAGEMAQGISAAAEAMLAAYGDRVSTIEGETDLAPGLTTVPLPGHTPGHTGVMVSSGDAQLLIFADIVHVAPVQLARPQVAIGFDTDADQAIATRQALLDQVATDGLTVAGTHIGFPGVVNIVRDGEGYRAVAAPFDYDA